MSKQFRSLASLFVLVMLLAVLVMPSSSVAKANDDLEASSSGSVDYIYEQPFYWCEFGSVYKGGSYNIFIQTDKVRNTTNQTVILDVNRSITLSHIIQVSGGFETPALSGALSFSVEMAVTHSVNVSVPVPPHNVGKVKSYARYVPYMSNYVCYWRGSNAVMSTGTIQVDRYDGTTYEPIVKPIND